MKVKSCKECPFLDYQGDCWACNLKAHLDMVHILSFEDEFNTPQDCPIRKKFTIKYENNTGYEE